MHASFLNRKKLSRVEVVIRVIETGPNPRFGNCSYLVNAAGIRCLPKVFSVLGGMGISSSWL